MEANALAIKVNDKSKTLRFSETLIAGSVYAVLVEGGADICGNHAVLGLKIGSTTVGWAELENGAGELSLLTQELADVLESVREGSRVVALVAIRCTDEGGDQVVAMGKADILYAGSEWFETTELARITSKGDKGDDGASAYEVAVRNGYTGTEAQWAQDMMGASTAAQSAAAAAATAFATAQQAENKAQQALNAVYTDAKAESVWSRLWSAAKAAAQTISGLWTFSTSPIVPTATAGDSSQKAASTAFVAAAVSAVAPGYSIVQQSLVNGAVTLADRSINLLALGSNTEATINFPPQTTGKVRDFWLVVTVAGVGDREISLVGGTCYGEHSTTFELAEGTVNPNVLVFTEIQSGVFIVRRRIFTVQGNTLT